jgi:hypothetical protein
MWTQPKYWRWTYVFANQNTGGGPMCSPTEILEVDLCVRQPKYWRWTYVFANRNTGGGPMCSPTEILEVDLCVRQPKYWRWTFTLLLIVRSCMSLTADLGYFE